jgi:hypothetical protein
MLRRQFLIGAASAAGTLLPFAGNGQVLPCGPGSLGAAGGSTASATCPGGASADWLARSTAKSVLWAHDFRADWEVNYFRFRSGVGMDPDAITPAVNSQMPATSVRRSSDGISGGSLEFVIDPGYASNWLWLRPFSPVRYATGTGPSNGQAVPDDRGFSSGMHVLDPYGVAGRKPNGWAWGYVAHAQDGAVMGVADGENRWSGNSEIYLQMVAKMAPERALDSAVADTKVFYFDEAGGDMGDEFVGMTLRNGGYPSMHFYTNGGGGDFARVKVPMGSRTRYIPQLTGSTERYQTDEYASCTVGEWNKGGAARAAACWTPPLGQWFTMLFRLVPGPKQQPIALPAGSNADNVAFDSFDANADGSLSVGEQVYSKDLGQFTMVEMSVHQPGWAGYRKVLTAPRQNFNWTDAIGWNALKLTIYTEGVTTGAPLYHRFAQVIASKSFIAAPTSYGP